MINNITKNKLVVMLVLIYLNVCSDSWEDDLKYLYEIDLLIDYHKPAVWLLFVWDRPTNRLSQASCLTIIRMR